MARPPTPEKKEQLPGYPLGSHERKVMREMRSLRLVGNIIPSIWLKRLRHEGSRRNQPRLAACMILSEVIYWYRELEVRDEATGDFVTLRKKFKADMMQRNYEAFARQFGFSKLVVKREIDYLVERGLLRREFRHGIITKQGKTASNVMYLEPVPHAIAALSEADDEAWE